MQHFFSFRFSALSLIASTAVALLAGLTEPVRAVTPESPEVKAVLQKGLKSIEGADDSRLGGKCLIGLCFLKNGSPATHLRVQSALSACERASTGNNEESIYSVGLAVIFLCELDPQKHRALIDKYVANLYRRQKSHGGWGYDDRPTGDTSQTQYAALGLWSAQRQADISVPMDRIERLCGWLLRTQDPSGGWGYQGVDPGNLNRVPQDSVHSSLVVAGLGSLYIAADLLGIGDQKEIRPEAGLPPALRLVEDQAATPRKPISKVIDSAVVRRAMADGNNWFQRNFTVQAAEWNHYYLYGMERYMSYRELAENRVEKEPRWYNEAFAYLQKTQQGSGDWTGEDALAINSSFAILFLLRSSKKAIQKVLPNLGEGVLLGGMGLPKNTSDLQERDGKIVETPLSGSIDELLAIIEDPKNAEAARLADSRQTLVLDSDVTKRSGQIARLRALVSAGTFETRQVAVRSLGKARDLDNVPFLLYALTDPDVRIVREADRALRFLSRKFAGVGLPDDPTQQDIRAAIQAWKTWYLGIRPDAELLD